MATAPKALIVDDHPLFRDALETALSLASGATALAVHAGSIKEALDQTDGNEFNLILLDLNLVDASGFDGLARLQSSGLTCPIVVVSASESDSIFQQAQTLGAAGYLPKSLGLQDLAAALATVLDGGQWFPETTSGATDDTDNTNRVASLTPAQRRVITGLSDGLLNKQIAYEMGISEATVKAHMTAIFRKLGANNRTQALLIYKSALGLDDHSAA
ncbi:MAG: response regulator transcription factor [Hyphomonadaceae bacterium]|nr:response regulator transcription factor [Hyphomonadaceae bacterium]